MQRHASLPGVVWWAAGVLALVLVPCATAGITFLNEDKPPLLSPDVDRPIRFIIRIDCQTYMAEAAQDPLGSEPSYLAVVEAFGKDLAGGYVETDEYHCNSGPRGDYDLVVAWQGKPRWSMPVGRGIANVSARLYGADNTGGGLGSPSGNGTIAVDVEPAAAYTMERPVALGNGKVEFPFSISANTKVNATIALSSLKWITCGVRVPAVWNSTTETVDQPGWQGGAHREARGRLLVTVSPPGDTGDCEPVLTANYGLHIFIDGERLASGTKFPAEQDLVAITFRPDEPRPRDTQTGSEDGDEPRAAPSPVVAALVVFCLAPFHRRRRDPVV